MSAKLHIFLKNTYFVNSTYGSYFFGKNFVKATFLYKQII